MITINDIFRHYGPAYRAQYGDRLLPSHRTAMTAIEACRTEALGGHIYTCAACATTRYSYHSCKNRHCPTYQHDAAQTWLARQQDLLFPVPYFLVTFTLPPSLRDLARTHQRQLYQLLFRASAAALQQLAHDPRFLGGQIGMLGVLQTWTRDLRFHPHVHYDSYIRIAYLHSPLFQDIPDNLDEPARDTVFLGGMRPAHRELNLGIAEAYKHAGDELVRIALAADAAYEFLYPIFFMYRHAIEVYLKILVPEKNDTHDFSRLTDAFRAKYKTEFAPWAKDRLDEFHRLTQKPTRSAMQTVERRYR